MTHAWQLSQLLYTSGRRFAELTSGHDNALGRPPLKVQDVCRMSASYPKKYFLDQTSDEGYSLKTESLEVQELLKHPLQTQVCSRMPGRQHTACLKVLELLLNSVKTEYVFKSMCPGDFEIGYTITVLFFLSILVIILTQTPNCLCWANQ